MDRLSSLDASFLRLETPAAHMHVGWLSLVRLPEGTRELDYELLRQRIGSRLHLAPRFRQRVVEVPVGDPVLADDPRFRLDDHVAGVTPARAITAAELRRATERFLSTPLRRDRPLWRIEVIPRLGGGRAAILGKVHHALVDGIAAVELGMLLFDLSPDASGADPVEWQPAPAASPARLAVDAATDTALDQFRTAGRMARMGLRPRETVRVAETMRRAALTVAEQFGRPAPPSYMNRPIGAHRSLETRSVSWARMARLRGRYGVKLNDLVLAVVTGALRRYAVVCDEPLDPLRAMVPVSVRAGEDSPATGNRIVFAFVELPVDEPGPAARIERIRDQTARIKSDGSVSGADRLLATIGQLPGPLRTQAARLAASPRLFNVTVSNVPGPRIPLYAANGIVEKIYPVIPLASDHALAVGVLSYADRLHFALHTDPVALPEGAELPRLIETAIAELEEATRPRRLSRDRGSTPRGRRPASRQEPAA